LALQPRTCLAARQRLCSTPADLLMRRRQGSTHAGHSWIIKIHTPSPRPVCLCLT
jgi:hypothetical protein